MFPCIMIGFIPQDEWKYVTYKLALAIKSTRRTFLSSWAIFEGIKIELSK